MVIHKRKSQITAFFSRFLGLILLVTLFALAELAPDTIANQRNPWVGVWSAKDSRSTNTYTLYMEDDGSFTWLVGDKRLMSGNYEVEHPTTLKMRFGDSEEDVLQYNYQFQNPNALILSHEKVTFSFQQLEHAE